MIGRSTKNKVISIFMILCVLIGDICHIKVSASVVDDSESAYEVKNSDGEKVLTITMKKGIITIIAKSNAASSSVRWETIGLTITKDDIETETTATHRTGPGPVSDAYGSGHAILWFKDAADKSDDSDGNMVTTTITFSASQVETALGENFDNITENTYIYLHGIFDTYQIDSNENKIIRSGGNIGIRNWETIMNAESWGSDTMDDFSKYYNMPIKFKPAKQPNTLKYITETGDDIGSKDLASVVPGGYVSWSDEPTEQTYNKKKYGLVGYYVTKAGSKKKIVSHYTDDGYSINKLKSGSAKVQLGGMIIYLVYREITAPTPTPKPSITTAPSPTPKLEEVTIPKADSESMPLTIASAVGEIRADGRGSEKFTATAGIPTTESLYGQVTATEYLLGYKFEKKVGKICYAVPVTKNYILKWKSATPDSAGGGKAQTQTIPVTRYISVSRAYGYWEITKLEYYNIEYAELNNYALPGGKLTLTPNSSYYNPPSISYYHTSDPDYHIIPPIEVLKGITLASETITGGTSKPVIPQEDFSYYALSQTGKINVRSDSLSFAGKTVISGSVTETEAPGVNTSSIPQCTTNTDRNVLYQYDQVIKATKSNGNYASSGNIVYKAIAKIGSINPDHINYAVLGVNNVLIHTPVLCNPIVTADNDKYVQLVSPMRDCVELVLDPDSTLNDFTLKISNTGFHTGIAGYFTRDFSESLHDKEASYIAEDNGLLRNEVKFPFDVFIDKGSDNKNSNDDYVKAGTWITIGKSTVRFYLPTWTTEGVYMADCRTVAVNVGDHIKDTEAFANRNRINYVANNTVKFEVSGRLYGLTLYDISDYPIWKEAFRIPNSSDLKKNSSKYQDGTGTITYNKNDSYTYTVGTNDQYGKDNGRNVKYTFPLVNGSHPYYKNQGIIKTGYMFRFSLNTIGSMFGDDASVVMKPSFYYVDKDGKNRTAVDLYYTEEINGKSKSLVKVGGNIDKTNLKSYNTGDLNLGIPPSEMKLTAALRNQRYGDLFWQYSPMFTFARIQLNYAFRTLVGQNYTDNIKKLDSFADIQKSGVKESDADKSMQRWYGQYYIPNEVHIVKKGYDIMDYAKKYGVDYDENFWLSDGYIIVNFNIYTVKNGRQYLSYINADNYLEQGNCSMWIMEGAPLAKKSNKGPAFNLYAGDVCIYYGNKKMGDDYSAGAIY